MRHKYCFALEGTQMLAHTNVCSGFFRDSRGMVPIQLFELRMGDRHTCGINLACLSIASYATSSDRHFCFCKQLSSPHYCVVGYQESYIDTLELYTRVSSSRELVLFCCQISQLSVLSQQNMLFCVCACWARCCSQHIVTAGVAYQAGSYAVQ